MEAGQLQNGGVMRSLWLCPTCLNDRKEAFSLHPPDAKVINCPYCGIQVWGELKFNSKIRPRVRKVALITLSSADCANSVLSSLNRHITRWLSLSLRSSPLSSLRYIPEQLCVLREAGFLLDAKLPASPDFLWEP